MLSGCPAQADFCADQVTQWARTLANHLPAKYTVKKKLRPAEGKQNLRCTCPKGKLFFFFKP